MPQQIRDNRILHTWLLRLRLTAPARIIATQAATQGYRVRVTGDGIRLARERRELWLRIEDSYQLALNFEMILRRAVFLEKGGREIADLRNDGLFRITQTGDHFHLHEVAELHECVAGYLRRGEPQPGETVFDAGAYVGEFSIVAARRVGPNGRVIAFEPDPRNRERLARNLRLAGVANVIVCPCGLWRDSGEVAFASRGNYRSRISAVDPNALPTASVPVLGWSDAVQRFGAPHFVKMDIEGAEIEVIDGARDWMRGHRVRFAIASYHWREGVRSATLLEPAFRAIGYEAETGNPEHLTTWAWKA